MYRIVTTAEIVQYDGTVIEVGSTGKVFSFNRDTCSFYADMDDGTFTFIKAWEFDRVEENA